MYFPVRQPQRQSHGLSACYTLSEECVYICSLNGSWWAFLAGAVPILTSVFIYHPGGGSVLIFVLGVSME